MLSLLGPALKLWLDRKIEDVSINNEYEYENDSKPYSYSKSFSQLSMLAMTPSVMISRTFWNLSTFAF